MLITPLIIGGGPTSGKGVLPALLDGHPEIFAIPMWHDGMIACLDDLQRSMPRIFLQLSRDYEKYLYVFLASSACTTRYMVLQIAAQARCMNFPLDSERSVPVPFTFAFSRFSEGLFADLLDMGMDFADVPRLFHAVFKNLHAELTGGGKPLPRYGVSVLPLDFCRYEMLRSMYPEAKCVFIRRDIIGAFAATIARNAKMNGQPIEKYMHQYCTNAYTLRIVKNVLNAERVAVAHPDFMVVFDFFELIQNTEYCLRKACAHLGLEYLPTMRQATFLGKPIALDAVGIVHDEPRNLLSAAQLDMLKTYIDYLRLQAERELEA